MKKPRPKPILIVDSREKTPFDVSNDPDFGGSITKKLDAGDYSLEGLEHIICIERKAGGNELFQNFCDEDGRERVRREMERLQKVKYRFIVIEQDLIDILSPDCYYVNQKKINRRSPNMPCAVVAKELINIMFDYNVQVIFAGPKAFNITKKLLLNAYRLYVNEQTDDT